MLLHIHVSVGLNLFKKFIFRIIYKYACITVKFYKAEWLAKCFTKYGYNLH